VIRTLDIGGDKSVPYIDIGAESNPFLGWRGIRVTLGRRDLFDTQLRAILRAAHERPIEVLLPMVSTLQELREARAIIRGVEQALHREDVPFRAGIPVGVMIEVPAAARIADQLALEASRLSIGTNDLVQYLMAADRTNSRVAHTADHFQPAVLRVIRDVVEAGRRAGVKVDVCGEMAADPLATPLLLGLGVEELSMSAPLIPEIKRAISRWSFAEAEGLARQALEAESPAQVRELLS
jgi:phosphocarrier protein FPr